MKGRDKDTFLEKSAGSIASSRLFWRIRWTVKLAGELPPLSRLAIIKRSWFDSPFDSNLTREWRGKICDLISYSPTPSIFGFGYDLLTLCFLIRRGRNFIFFEKLFLKNSSFCEGTRLEWSPRVRNQAVYRSHQRDGDSSRRLIEYEKRERRIWLISISLHLFWWLPLDCLISQILTSFKVWFLHPLLFKGNF